MVDLTVNGLLRFFLLRPQVNFKLRGLAEKTGCDVGMFKQLANSVEEFSYRLLDPLKSDPGWCKQFGDNSLDYILDDAIELEQKKVTLAQHMYRCTRIRALK